MIALIKKIIHKILVLLHLKKEVVAAVAEAKAAVEAPVVKIEDEVKKDV